MLLLSLSSMSKDATLQNLRTKATLRRRGSSLSHALTVPAFQNKKVVCDQRQSVLGGRDGTLVVHINKLCSLLGSNMVRRCQQGMKRIIFGQHICFSIWVRTPFHKLFYLNNSANN